MKAEGRSPQKDTNYLMALKLGNSPEFEGRVWAYLEAQESEPAREMAEYLFLERSRDEVIGELFSY